MIYNHRKKLFKSKKYKMLIKQLYEHQVPFEYPISIMSRKEYYFLDETDGIKGVAGFCRVYGKWVNPLSKYIGNKKVLEVMSGNGTLAYALKKRGTDIIATDSYSWNSFVNRNTWPIKIEEVDVVDAVMKYGNKADYILMAWPPYNSPLAYKVIKKNV